MNKGIYMAALAALALPLAAQSEGLSFAAKIGTLGLTAEVSKSVSEHFAVRAGVNGFDYDYDSTEAGIDYNLELGLQSVSVAADWYPTGGTFRVSGGVLFNGNEVTASSVPVVGGTITVGDMAFSADQVGTLRSQVDFESVAPYLGVGWDARFGQSGWGMSFDVGVALQGSPQVALTADGAIATDPIFTAELERERQEFEDSIDGYEYYPVAVLGFSYRF